MTLRYRTNSKTNDRLAYRRPGICYFALFPALLAVMVACRDSAQVSDQLYPYYVNEQTFSGQGVVYVYAPVSNPDLPAEYWHFRFIPDWRGNVLKSALYDPAGTLTQESVERLEPDQAELMSLELMYLADTGTVTIMPTINVRETFPFGQIDSTRKALYQIEYWDTSEDSVRVILTKERQIVETLLYPLQGEQVPAVRCSVTETLETETQGFTESTWQGTEIYGQDIGLIYYKKEISEQFVMEYSLVDRMSFEEFRSLLRGGSD
ncbi:MAG: hypothetical protein R3330_00650 [Saprospiraceae bacterium]|nr:hypothetical protein [Saprospiraceae bacterium]